VGRDARDVEVIWGKSEREYFCEGDWTTQITLESLGKSSSKRIRIPDQIATQQRNDAVGQQVIFAKKKKEAAK
jgi:hypothetical protein